MTAADRHISGEDLVAYALGEHAPAQAAEIDAHIGACSVCRDEYAGLVEVFGSLALGAPSAPAPPGLRSAILAAAADERQGAAPVPTATRARAPRWSWPAASRWGTRVAVAGALVAALVAVAVIVGTTPSGGTSVRLSGVPGSVQVVGDRAALDAASFVPLPSGRTYELWVIRGTGIRPAGLFAGRAGFVPLAGVVRPGDVVAVTDEPSAGSRQPTSAPLAEARVD